MTSNVQAVMALCAISGFVIVWLVLPTNRTKTPFANDTTFGDSSSSSEGDAESGCQKEEPSNAQSTYSGQRPRWCDILHLEPDASPSAVRKAYARLMKGLHPDIAGGDEYTTRQCALVQEAYRQALQDRRTRM